MSDNPKMIAAQKAGKVPFERIPFGPLAAVARVMATGGDKYGIRNFLLDEIKASTYLGAIGRHAFLEWSLGVDEDKDSGEHPLAHVIACCLIVLDSIEHGSLIDDRLVQESKDPETGKVKRYDPLDDDFDDKLSDFFAPLRRHKQLSDKLLDRALNMPGHDPIGLTAEEWTELESLHRSESLRAAQPYC